MFGVASCGSLAENLYVVLAGAMYSQQLGGGDELAGTVHYRYTKDS